MSDNIAALSDASTAELESGGTVFLAADDGVQIKGRAA